MNHELIKFKQYGYTAEWALAKFFPALFDYGLLEKFDPVAICGREADKNQVRSRLLEEEIKRINALGEDRSWRKRNTIKETESCLNLYLKLGNGWNYEDITTGSNGSGADYDAGIIHTANIFHIILLKTLMENGKHILCEKPLVVVTNDKHQADRSKLDELEQLVKNHGTDLILMDAEHYSAKRATITFYERVGDMIAKYGHISKIEGYTIEKDDPSKDRTRKLLSLNNRTGLLLDMGVHLFGIISNIEGKIGAIDHAEYGVYPGKGNISSYDTETAVNTAFNIKGNHFVNSAVGEFTFVKFSDQLKDYYVNILKERIGDELAISPEGKIAEDYKKIKITFEKGQNGDCKNGNHENSNQNGKPTVVTIDFRKGTVTDDHISNKDTIWYSTSNPSSEEYVNILNDFYLAIQRHQQPRTNFEHSIQNLDAIFRVYRDFPFRNNQFGVYLP
jgi:predicted dehydrogenase